MAEAAACGVPPHLFWDYTYRELTAALAGAKLQTRRAFKLNLWTVWQGVNLSRNKKLPELRGLLSKLDPIRDMSAQEIRKAVLGIAQSLGATVVRRKRGE